MKLSEKIQGNLPPTVADMDVADFKKGLPGDIFGEAVSKFLSGKPEKEPKPKPKK